uniref:Notch n=1 Tax=Angiostrongylus cantonensis TaxID=6313 RepID=A0A0K0DJG2_ANGCA
MAPVTFEIQFCHRSLGDDSTNTAGVLVEIGFWRPGVIALSVRFREQCEVELCPSHPCVSGYCNAAEDGRKTCQCDYRFEGQYCELDKDECSLRPCPSDAECVNHVAKHKKDKGYSCLCPIGYTGEFCEVEVDLCEIYKKKARVFSFRVRTTVTTEESVVLVTFVFARMDLVVPVAPTACHILGSTKNLASCPERPEVCAKVFDNGRCDEVCNRESCLFDGFDCVKRDDFVCRNPSDCAYKYGDGHCDDDCAGAECGFDGGDCNGSKNAFRSRNVNMIGVALGLPPDIAVKNLRQLQAELAQWCYSIPSACVLKSFCQRLYTHVSLAQDVDGVMVYEWSSDHGQGNRVVLNEELASAVQTTATGTIIFFDVDTSACRLKSRGNYSQPHCFTDLRAAATYLALELTRFRPISGKTLPIRDITWKQRQIVGYPGCSYQPPTPPYSTSPENGKKEEYSHFSLLTSQNTRSKDAENSLAPIIDGEKIVVITAIYAQYFLPIF